MRLMKQLRICVIASLRAWGVSVEEIDVRDGNHIEHVITLNIISKLAGYTYFSQ